MKIEKDKVVSLIYELRENDGNGKIIEALEETKPMTFIFGSGRLLPYFEVNLTSLTKGDDFNFLLDTENAYGSRREEMIINVPRSIFEADGKLDENICQVGNDVPMMDRDGHRINGVINEITDTYVRMDFNHPMAGLNLHFSGIILDVRDASPEEIAGMNHSCSSCGSNDVESGCSGSCS
jgi:FKBP-type peptidyl-prolyl cis-trans isomerase SlyD